MEDDMCPGRTQASPAGAVSKTPNVFSDTGEGRKRVGKACGSKVGSKEA